MKVRRHFPGFVDTDEPRDHEIAAPADLFALPWVRAWEAERSFRRFSVSRPYPGSGWNVLMAELADSWWVVAYLPEGVDFGLPDWVRPGPAPVFFPMCPGPS